MPEARTGAGAAVYDLCNLASIGGDREAEPLRDRNLYWDFYLELSIKLPNRVGRQSAIISADGELKTKDSEASDLRVDPEADRSAGT